MSAEVQESGGKNGKSKQKKFAVTGRLYSDGGHEYVA